MILSRFQTVGRDLFARGLVSSSSGNLSIRMGDNLIITRRGCMLNGIEEPDLIETGITRNSRATPLASSELAAHRAIYRETNAMAVVHAHPPHAIAIAMTTDEIVTGGAEGLSVMGNVPVVGKQPVEKEKLDGMIARALKQSRGIMAYGHGSFAVGQLLEEAFNCTTALEEVCHVLYLTRSLQVSPADE